MTTNNDAAETRDAGFDPEHLDPVPKGRNIVIVIGINDYQHWKKLNNAVSDAWGIRNLFVETFGFSEPVPHLFDGDATKSAIVSLVEDQLRTELKPDDALILFFAGHGTTQVAKLEDEEIETGYLVPIDANRDQWSDCITMADWLGAVSRLPARHIMVILDACHSGFGIGQEMEIYRDPVRYEQDLVRRRSRKVFTSAKRDQRALDGGPIAGHSLFTGTLIDGLNWGKADLDGNGLITGSELGLYVQQQVGQHSNSQQTPDFGSFRLDKRGELVIKLGDNSFDALKAQAFAALQRAEMDRFAELVPQVADLRSKSPETLFLQYRLAFYEGNIKAAQEILYKLEGMDFREGTIPLSREEIWKLRLEFDYWHKVLSIPAKNSPLEIQVLIGRENQVVPVNEQSIGTLKAYSFKLGSGYRRQFKITNVTDASEYVYMLEISTTGRLHFIPLWPIRSTAKLAPKETRLTNFIVVTGDPGLSQVRFFSSPVEIPELLSPPDFAPVEVAWDPEFPPDEVAKLRMKAINFVNVLSSPGTGSK